jgi:hypothetical protein
MSDGLKHNDHSHQLNPISHADLGRWHILGIPIFEIFELDSFWYHDAMLRSHAPGVLAVPVLALLLGVGCGDDDTAPSDGGPDDGATGCLPAFEVGGEGHAQPLAASPGEARAGRVTEAELPSYPFQVWEGGDFVLANDRVAIVIEDVGDSDLYDPWGGRPVGVARMEGGALVEPAEFGEFFILTGRFTVMTESVTVLRDGSDGGAAIVRATGPLAPLPFLENLVGPLFIQPFDGVRVAIDYVLEPDSDHVDIVLSYRSERDADVTTPPVLHGFMYTYRMTTYRPGLGFNASGSDLGYIGFIDDHGTSYAYSVPGELLGGGIQQSGFDSAFTSTFTVPTCEALQRTHARLTIGGPGLDGLLQVVAAEGGTALREISGEITDPAGDPAGVRVHAEMVPENAEDDHGEYLTRTFTDDTGHYSLHVPADADVQLWAYRVGDAVLGPEVVEAPATVHDMALGPTGLIHVTASEVGGGALPVRVQVEPLGDTALPRVPGSFGEPPETRDRTRVEYPMDGDVTLRVPVGEYRVIVSRGYEYEMHDSLDEGPVVVTDSDIPEEVNAELERVVDTTNVLCGDFHIHTRRSNDSADDPAMKVRTAVADGVDILLRTEHEYVEPFQHLIEAQGLEQWTYGLTSVEMTSFVLWGHMNIFPLEYDPSAINGGAPLWQEWPTPDQPDRPFRTLSPVEVFDAARARPEQPAVIINHPRGTTNYFDYVDYNPFTGSVAREADWDETFTLVEVFNNSGWQRNRDGTVRDWLSLLDHGRRVFAVGASDSHGMERSPVGYPRTCLQVGTDDPTDLTPAMVLEASLAGHSTISGGIYVDAWVGDAGPGDQVMGVGASTNVSIRVQAAGWVSVEHMEVIVDGVVVDEYDLSEDAYADPGNSTVRFEDEVPIDVAPGGSYVVVAVYGERSTGLNPVHPGRESFGVTNPIFLFP